MLFGIVIVIFLLQLLQTEQSSMWTIRNSARRKRSSSPTLSYSARGSPRRPSPWSHPHRQTSTSTSTVPARWPTWPCTTPRGLSWRCSHDSLTGKNLPSSPDLLSQSTSQRAKLAGMSPSNDLQSKIYTY